MIPESSILRECTRAASTASARWSLPLRSRLWQGVAGEMAGYGTGASMDFQDHRQYAPGDDPRHINWQAYARTGQYTLKLYREETRPFVEIWFDATPSMFLNLAKARRSIELFHFAIESARRCGAQIEIRALTAGRAHPLPIAECAAGDWARFLPEAEAGKSLPPPHEIQTRSGSLRVLISDLLFPGDPSPWTRLLSARGGSGIIFAPFAREEADPGWSGTCDFVDVETVERRSHVVPPPVLRRYLDAYATHFRVWKDLSRKFHLAIARVPASGDLESALAHEATRNGVVEPN